VKDSLDRIGAMMLRHFYILRGSWSRLFDVVYWPTITMVMWGFISRYYGAQAGPVHLAAALLSAVLLWDALFRVQLGMSFTYLEEIWSRNLGHLFVSPLRPWEWCASMMLSGVCRMLMGVVPAMLLAVPFYGFSVFSLGLPLLAFLLNLVFMGWWLGLLAASLLLRTGPGAESLVWALTWFLAPFSAVYYPVTALPEWLQPFSLALPASHVFEGLRTLLAHGFFDWAQAGAALALNAAYLACAGVLFRLAFTCARRDGMLFQTGE
jgi:ABC-2 type transport system permease protein